MTLDNLRSIKEAADRIKREIKKVILGVPRVVDLVVISLFSKGHCLLEGPPGQAKTTLFLALSKTINGRFVRFQGLPDALPSDILYATDLDDKGHLKFDFGTLVKESKNLGIVLIDEINRFQSKTQSVFLEAMQERKITLATRTVELPHGIFVATRNPLEKQQTYELPAAQRDRFLMEIELNYPDIQSEKQIISLPKFQNMGKLIEEVEKCIELTEISKAHNIIQEQIKTSENLINYVCEIIKATRNPKRCGIETDKWLKAGVSTRGGIKLLEAAKTSAALRGDDVVLPQDIQNVLNEVLAHRIFIQPFAEARRSNIVKEFLENIKKVIRAPD